MTQVLELFVAILEGFDDPLVALIFGDKGDVFKCDLHVEHWNQVIFVNWLQR